jgi:hypothetical protein
MYVQMDRGGNNATDSRGDHQPHCFACGHLEWIDSNGFGELEIAFIDLKIAAERGCRTCSVIFQGILAFQAGHTESRTYLTNLLGLELLRSDLEFYSFT